MLINIKKMLFIIYQIWVILSKPQQILKISWTVSHLVGQVFLNESVNEPVKWSVNYSFWKRIYKLISLQSDQPVNQLVGCSMK